jgi:hypothetical protein
MKLVTISLLPIVSEPLSSLLLLSSTFFKERALARFVLR